MQTTVIRGNQVRLIPLPRAGGALLRTAPSIGDAFSSVKCQSIQRACFYCRRICLGPSVRRRYPRHVWTWTLLAATSPRAALAAHAPYSSVAPAVPLAIGRPPNCESDAVVARLYLLLLRYPLLGDLRIRCLPDCRNCLAAQRSAGIPVWSTQNARWEPDVDVGTAIAS